MRSRTPEDLSGKCERCFLRRDFCFCDLIPRIENRVRVVIVRHVHEAWKTTNTARMAAHALVNSELLDYGAKDRRFDERVLLEQDSWLLFPGDEPAVPALARPARLIVLDGTWHQARKIFKGVPALWTMPKLSLGPPAADSRRLRQPPHEHGMSTLEAVAQAMALLEGEETGRQLDQLHADMLDRVLDIRGRQRER